MTATDSDTPQPKRRRWYVLHLDTYVVLLLVLVPWVMIVVPGQFVGSSGMTGWNASQFAHGWPFVHMRRLDLNVNVGFPADSATRLANSWKMLWMGAPWLAQAGAPVWRDVEDDRWWLDDTKLLIDNIEWLLADSALFLQGR